MENVGRRMVEIAEMVVPSVSAREIHDRRESGESIVILDIREPDGFQWQTSHVPTAVDNSHYLGLGRCHYGRLSTLLPLGSRRP